MVTTHNHPARPILVRQQTAPSAPEQLGVLIHPGLKLCAWRGQVKTEGEFVDIDTANKAIIIKDETGIYRTIPVATARFTIIARHINFAKLDHNTLMINTNSAPFENINERGGRRAFTGKIAFLPFGYQFDKWR